MDYNETWESREGDGFILPQLNQTYTPDKLRYLEERKLAEEADNELTRGLFEDDGIYTKEDDLKDKSKISFTPTNLTPSRISLITTNKPKTPNKCATKLSNQLLNEEKQKKISSVRKALHPW